MQPLKNLQEGKKLIGKAFEVIRDTSGHEIPIGTRIKLFTVGMIGNSVVFYSEQYEPPLRAKEIEPVQLTLEELEKEYEELLSYSKREIKELETKIDFMKEKEVELFNEEDYNIYITLKAINNSTDIKEKEALLKTLVNR